MKFWRSGLSYFRSEEVADSSKGSQALTISNSPDAWSINLLDNSGVHAVDPGPTFNSICPIFGPPRKDGIGKLEFGMEQAFFDYYGARKLPDEVVNSVSCEVYELTRLYWLLKLSVRKDTQLPFKLSRRGPDGTYSAVYFEEYSSGLEIDFGLFLPPDGVTFEER